MIDNAKILDWLKALSARYEEKKDYLTELDSAIGDADHGINMSRGFSAIIAELDQKKPTSMAESCKIAAMGLIKHVGGSAGPLYGTFFLKISKELEGKAAASMTDMYTAFQAGYNGLVERGRAHPGDKTMLDVWFPVLEKMKALIAQGLADEKTLMPQLVSLAEKSMISTIPMLAKKGRASYLGERSIGHQDPGATSSYYMLDIAAKIWMR